MNELLIICSVIFIYGAALITYRFWGKSGLYCLSAVATILANIEVVMLIHAFGMEQTLGNILFAVTFLITDILSECEGKKEANRAVCISIFASLFFLALSQSWQFYIPSVNDAMHPFVVKVFSNTPRIIIASLLVYALSQFFDVWLYHKWWKLTENKFGDKKRCLWFRNNFSTLISQILNTALFNIFAFAGIFDINTMIEIFLSSYIMFIFTSILDTPVLYLARYMKNKNQIA